MSVDIDGAILFFQMQLHLDQCNTFNNKCIICCQLLTAIINVNCRVSLYIENLEESVVNAVFALRLSNLTLIRGS